MVLLSALCLAEKAEGQDIEQAHIHKLYEVRWSIITLYGIKKNNFNTCKNVIYILSRKGEETITKDYNSSTIAS